MSIRRWYVLAVAIVATAFVVEPAFAGRGKGGRINAARKRVSANKKSHSRSRSQPRSKQRDSGGNESDSSSSSSSYGDDGYWPHYSEDFEKPESALSKIQSRMFTFPFWLPVFATKDKPFRLGMYRHARYPYAKGVSGHIQRVSRKQSGLGLDADRWYSLRLQSSFERHAANLHGIRLRATLQTASRFNLDASVTRYEEKLDFGRDVLWHYKILGTYSFAVSPRTHFSAGLGVRSLVFLGGEDAIGVISRYSAEFFPAKPVHFWIGGEVGGGRGGLMSEFETGIGVLIKRVELYAGYRAFKVAGVPFHGPQIGAMLWL